MSKLDYYVTEAAKRKIGVCPPCSCNIHSVLRVSPDHLGDCAVVVWRGICLMEEEAICRELVEAVRPTETCSLCEVSPPHPCPKCGLYPSNKAV